MANRMSASRICLECGTVLSPLALPAVRSFFFAHSRRFIKSPTEAFAATGWRVGWLIGPPSIIRPTLAATTRIVFCTNSPLQEAAAAGLEQAEQRGYFATQRAEYAERRAIITDAFDKLGLTYTLPEGTYFILLVHNSVFGLSITHPRAGRIERQIPRRLPFPSERPRARP